MKPIDRARKGRPAFTLIELLAVVAIAGILLALAYSGSRGMTAKSQSTRCMANMRLIHLAAEAYSQDNDGRLVPGSSLGASPFWINSLRPYLEGKNTWDTNVDNRIRCPSLKPGRPNYWAWGYGMNAKPGYEGPSSSSYDKLANWGPASSGWTRPFTTVSVTHKSRRLFLCDAVEWQIDPPASTNAIANFPDYHRHGKNACNVLFFDGHVESLNSEAINRSLFNPGNQ